MDKTLATLLNNFDRGAISRRHLLQLLGVAAVVSPVSAFAQGGCGGAEAGTPRCNTAPFPPPFEPTGWRTVLMDHFSMQVENYRKEAAYYNALMGWKIRSDDGSKAVLDIGDWGTVVIRGGLVVPPVPSPPPAVAPTVAVWDSFCWGIAPWDTKLVQAQLTKRGLNPVADHQGRDFQSFHVKDPDGFDVQISNGNRQNRRTTPANGKLSEPPPFESTAWKTLWLDHISFRVTSYKESVAFYEALLGWKPTGDEGSQNECEIGPDLGNIIIRGGNANAPGGLAVGRGRRAVMNHVSFGIASFDPDKVKAELQKRGLTSREDTGATGDIHVTQYKSYHTTTPSGYDLQISNTVGR